MIERDWHGCYSQSWNGQITPDAFAHPAKFARGLIRRIYQHALEQGYLKLGDMVLDPFGGVGLGAVDAISLGLDWVGFELEEKFVKLGAGNIALWEHQRRGQRYIDNLPELGKAVLLQGDSRYLYDVLGEAGSVVSSPPYSNRTVHGNHGLQVDKFKEPGKVGTTSHAVGEHEMDDYGTTPGQLGAMRVVSSPPYADGCQHTGGDDPNPEHVEGGKLYSVGISGAVSSLPYAESIGSDDPDKRGGLYRDEKRRNDKTLTAEYGESVGQLGRMRVVSSPPWIQSQGGERGIVENGYGDGFDKVGDRSYAKHTKAFDSSNLANTNDFWQAAHQIMQQVAQVLPPGAVSIWVLKGFIRNKEYVDFPDQWRQLGEACGFETLEWIRAWLVEDRGTQHKLFGGVERKTVQRKSFFRRLAESKGSPPIDYEVVLIQVKQ